MMKKTKIDTRKPHLKSGFMIGYDIEVNTDIAAQGAFDRMAEVGFDALTEQEMTLASSWLFVGKVANGGFRVFFSSSAGDVAFYAPTALKKIGADRMSAIAAKANRVFGAKGPPRERSARRKLVRAFPEQVVEELEMLESSFYKCADDVDALLEKYLKKDGAA
jgi:hypothetical protein